MEQQPRPYDAVLGTFSPSSYQQDIFNWVQYGTGNALVEAVAGSGKTTTLIKASQRIYGKKVLFCAFNASIAKTLKEKLNNRGEAKTIHSLGLKILHEHLKKTVVDQDKYSKLVKPHIDPIIKPLEGEYQRQMRRWFTYGQIGHEPDPPPTKEMVKEDLRTLIKFCQISLTDATDTEKVQKMVNYFGLQLNLSLGRLLKPLKKVLSEGEQIAKSDKIVDFGDMLWLPNLWRLFPSFRFDWIFCDEAQDLSKGQLEIVLKYCKPKGRMLFCGDPKQAIYGFAGASHGRIEQIIKRTNAIKLPLSICYRCPQSHLDKARILVPQIEAAPNAEEGILDIVKRDVLAETIREGDLVICRRTAPLIKLCIELIGNHISACVAGRDVGKSLVELVKHVAKYQSFNFSAFPQFLKLYEANQIERLNKKLNPSSQIESLLDRIKGIRVCYEEFKSPSLEVFCSELETLFSDDRPKVLLSTIHKAKGTEANRVFILAPELLPLRWEDQQDRELQEELNIKYVALTRAKQSLYLIIDEDSKKQHPSDKILPIY